MPAEENQIADLFAAPLSAGQPQGGQPQLDKPQGYPPFEKGVYRLRGRGMTGGTYKSGKFMGRPFGRFTFEIVDGPHAGRQVSYTLPWIAGQPRWEPFHVSFRFLTGMNTQEFDDYCRANEIVDAQARAQAMVARFRGALFDVEVRPNFDNNGKEWLNVWNIQARVAEPSAVQAASSPTPEPAAQPSRAATAPSSPAAAAPASAPAEPTVEQEIAKLMGELKMSREDMVALCEEEFGATSLAELNPSAREQLRDLLQERVLLGATGEKDLPF